MPLQGARSPWVGSNVSSCPAAIFELDREIDRATNHRGTMSDDHIRDTSYRNHLSHYDRTGKRKLLHPRFPKGRLATMRMVMAIALLAVFFVGPFIRINGKPLLLVDILNRNFVLFGVTFWPQDLFIILVGIITFAVGIILFTVAFGRLWCGWACPQTIWLEWVFRRIEHLIEGPPKKRIALAKAPWGPKKIVIKLGKQAVFFGIALLVSLTFLAYLIGSERMLSYLSDGFAAHTGAFLGVLAFAGLFWFIFASFRENACILICPYGRLQGVMLDENSIQVTYDWKRGEPRMPLREAKQVEHPGDCIDDDQMCVQVCPTGIDIRNGSQLECVNCTACIDACNAVMAKIGRPRGLIRYAGINEIEAGRKTRFTPRMALYSVVLAVLAGVLVFMLTTRSVTETTILRAPGMTYTEAPDGRIRNLYTAKVINKTDRAMELEFRLVEPGGGEIQMVGQHQDLPPGGVLEGVFLVLVPPDVLKRGKNPVTVEVWDGEQRLETVRTLFTGPL